MKKQFLILAIFAGGLATISAKTAPIGNEECPDRCSSNNDTLCCKTAGGSTYYGYLI
ncbi:MAG: hypothetical protein ACK5M1_05375 [Xanthomarina gelatinilytica]|uniref:hypothetical protein n=1 Tax=Xanthomarina gelatinilytica TaxID=1137281 RepID=UPI003A8C4819